MGLHILITPDSNPPIYWVVITSKLSKKINDFFTLRSEQLQFINNNYPSLIKLSYATTGFVAIMAHVFLKEKNELIDNWFDSEMKMLIHSAFPYSILFRFFYFAPKLSKKIIKRIF